MKTHTISMDHLDSLSDVELHRALLQNGLPNIPVTETTRGLLIKRLRNHLKKEKLNRKLSTHNKVKQRHTENSHFNNQYYTMDNGSSRFEPPSPNLLSSTSNSFTSSFEMNSSHQRQTSPKMYAPPPILASESCEDFRKTNFSSYNNNAPPPPKYQNQMQMGMVGRLLSFRESTLRRKPPSLQNNEVQKLSYRSLKPFRESSPFSLKQFVSRFITRRGTHQSIISQVLVAAFFIFFIAIAFIYTTMDYSNAIREKNSLISIVCDNIKNDTPHCIEKENLSKALILYKELLNTLQDRIKHYYCVNKNSPTALSIADFIDESGGAGSGSGRSLTTVLRDMEHLINNNPQWKIAITDRNGHPATLSDQSDITIHETYFKLVKPSLPMLCIFVSKVRQFFIIIGTVGLIVGIIALCYAIYCYVRQQKKLGDEQTERFASEIINELIEASKRGYDEEIVIINLRDKLLPLNNRNSLIKPWQRALDLLEANESRIQFGLKLKNGEEVRTIKWVGGTLETPNDITKAKKWQSPAFDNRNQKINDPPTPCLKIRHMFDCTEVNNPNLSQLIYNAIVEKVGPKCKILDIQLDKQTCCVYVRCATEADAGAIHNEINGWWFDKRLVSSKFLRLERYLSRFPKSRVSLNG